MISCYIPVLWLELVSYYLVVLLLLLLSLLSLLSLLLFNIFFNEQRKECNSALPGYHRYRAGEKDGAVDVISSSQIPPGWRGGERCVTEDGRCQCEAHVRAEEARERVEEGQSPSEEGQSLR